MRGDFDVALLLDPGDGLDAAVVDAAQDAQVEAEASARREDRRVGSAVALLFPGIASLPDPPQGATFDVNGAIGDNLVTDSKDPHGVWKIGVSLEAPFIAGPGEPVDITLSLPGADPVTRSIPMVQYADITSPAAGAEISRRADIDVAWSAASPGEAD